LKKEAAAWEKNFTLAAELAAEAADLLKRRRHSKIVLTVFGYT
jgi:hypothetical protein